MLEFSFFLPCTKTYVYMVLITMALKIRYLSGSPASSGTFYSRNLFLLFFIKTLLRILAWSPLASPSPLTLALWSVSDLMLALSRGLLRRKRSLRPLRWPRALTGEHAPFPSATAGPVALPRDSGGQTGCEAFRERRWRTVEWVLWIRHSQASLNIFLCPADKFCIWKFLFRF